jgi:hypothetical protein
MLTGYHELGAELRPESRYGSEESRRRLASNGDIWQTDDGDEAETKGGGGRCRRRPLADTFRILLFGKTEAGKSVLFDVDYWPTLVVQVPSVGRGREFAEGLRARLERCGSFGGFKYGIQRLKPTAGFFPDLTAAAQSRNPPRTGTKPFLFVWVKNLRMYFIARKIAREAQGGVEVVESSIPQTLRLLQQIGAEPGGIVEANTKEMVEKRTERFSNCDLEYRCFSVRPWPDSKPPPFRPCPGADTIFPLRIMSFDIETFSEDGFPDSPELNDQVISICATILDTGTGKKTKTVHALHKYTPLQSRPDIVYQKHFATEAELLESWSDFLKTVDIVVQYNGDGYVANSPTLILVLSKYPTQVRLAVRDEAGKEGLRSLLAVLVLLPAYPLPIFSHHLGVQQQRVRRFAEPPSRFARHHERGRPDVGEAEQKV